MKEQTEFNIRKHIDLKEAVVEMDFDFYDDICVKEEVIHTEMLEGDDLYDADVNRNLILPNYLPEEDIYVNEEIVQTECDSHEAIVETDSGSEWSHAYGVCETTQGGHKEHTVKDEVVIGSELNLQGVFNTGNEVATQGLSVEQQNEKEKHIDKGEYQDVDIKKELEPEAVSEVTQDSLYEHTVKDELVSPDALQLRDNVNTTGEADTGDSLYEQQQRKDENIHMQEDKHEAHIKVEREPDDTCGVSEAATLESLYEEHIVKDELVIGPEVLQPRDITRIADVIQRRRPVREEGVFNFCKICLKFLSEQSVADHTCVLFTCDICHDIFPREYLMVKHKRLHTQESFDCVICPESFPSKSCLTAHRRSHMGNMPFTCEICRKQFTRWCNLNRHMAGASCRAASSEESESLQSIVDWNQDWKSHVDSLCDRLSGLIDVLSKTATLLTGDALKKVYFAQFHSIMSQGALMWGNSEYANKVLVLQERAIRILAGVAPEHPSKPLFISQRIMTHYSQYIFELLLFVRTKMSQFACKKGRLKPIRRSRALSEKNPRVIGPTFYEYLPFELKNEPSDEEFMLRLSNILIESPLYSVSEYMELNFGIKK